MKIDEEDLGLLLFLLIGSASCFGLGQTIVGLLFLVSFLFVYSIHNFRWK